MLEQSGRLDVLEARMKSISISGLSVPYLPARFMCQYSGSLIGKHFKSLAQVMAFLCYDIVGSDLLAVWLLLGRLIVLLWQTEITDLDAYLVRRAYNSLLQWC